MSEMAPLLAARLLALLVATHPLEVALRRAEAAEALAVFNEHSRTPAAVTAEDVSSHKEKGSSFVVQP